MPAYPPPSPPQAGKTQASAFAGAFCSGRSRSGCPAPQRVTVDRVNVDRAPGPATGAVHVQPWHAGEHGCSDRWRPKRATTRRECLIPPLDDRTRLRLRSLIFAPHPVSINHVGDAAANTHVRMPAGSVLMMTMHVVPVPIVATVARPLIAEFITTATRDGWTDALPPLAVRSTFPGRCCIGVAGNQECDHGANRGCSQAFRAHDRRPPVKNSTAVVARPGTGLTTRPC